LTKTVKPKLETSTFWCLQGFFLNSLKKEAHYYLQQSGRGTLILNYLRKGKERLRIEGKESFQAQCMRDYWSPLLFSSILPKGSTGAVEAKGDLHSRAMETMKEA
jgi:hypothetical protein